MIAARVRSVLAVAAAMVVLATPARSDEYTDALRRALLLSNRPNVKLLPLGRSPKNRAIPALAISDFSSDPKTKLRVLVCAGQHGDEPNPVTAALDLSSRISADPQLLSRCVFIVVPMANPDGLAAGRRVTSQSIDMNRDWVHRKSVESQFVHGLISVWRPHVLFDLHEWPAPPNGPANTVEAAYCSSHGRRESLDRIAKAACLISGLALVKTAREANATLFDRHYTSSGYASFMIETAPGLPADTKSRLYQSAVVSAVRDVLGANDKLAALSPSAGALPQQTAAAYFTSHAIAAPQPCSAVVTAICVYILSLLPGRRWRPDKERLWSRRYVRCELPDGLIDDRSPKRKRLTPLTARSWSRRRLRSRYSGFPATLGQIAPSVPTTRPRVTLSR